jgi:NitT/TauT family transport system permease protein
MTEDIHTTAPRRRTPAASSRWWLSPAYAVGRAVARTRPLSLLTVLAFLLLWHFASTSQISGVSQAPTPAEVLRHFLAVFATDPDYWRSWLVSWERVATGFAIAVALAVPTGVLFGLSTTFRRIVFPVFELMRPIPPLAWVPMAILFWPTHHMSIVFITFIGAYFIITINVFYGIQELPRHYLWLARSMGARRRHILFRIILPAIAPSLCTGMTLAIAISWNVLIAAEMVAGSAGLGRLTWEGYISGTPPMVVVGMISIGVAGYLSSLIIDIIERFMTPWARGRSHHGH